jgi:Ran GTPase-activating protein (RanGAP) involved in mRNA processing and transport
MLCIGQYINKTYSIIHIRKGTGRFLSGNTFGHNIDRRCPHQLENVRKTERVHSCFLFYLLVKDNLNSSLTVILMTIKQYIVGGHPR